MDDKAIPVEGKTISANMARKLVTAIYSSCLPGMKYADGDKFDIKMFDGSVMFLVKKLLNKSSGELVFLEAAKLLRSGGHREARRDNPTPG
jgi:hypothetical protein